MAAEVNPLSRQLSILRAEREIFEAVYRKLPPIAKLTPPPIAPTPAASGAAGHVGSASAEAPDESEGLAAELEEAEEKRDHGGILRVAKRASELTRSESDAALVAQAILERATRAASTLAMLAAFEVVDTDRPVRVGPRGQLALARRRQHFAAQGGTLDPRARARAASRGGAQRRRLGGEHAHPDRAR
jgi:hypothetical protein